MAESHSTRPFPNASDLAVAGAFQEIAGLHEGAMAAEQRADDLAGDVAVVRAENVSLRELLSAALEQLYTLNAALDNARSEIYRLRDDRAS